VIVKKKFTTNNANTAYRAMLWRIASSHKTKATLSISVIINQIYYCKVVVKPYLSPIETRRGQSPVQEPHLDDLQQRLLIKGIV